MNGPLWPLAEPAHAVVTVDADDQAIPQFSRCREVGRMPEVQHVENPIREDNSVTCRTPSLQLGTQRRRNHAAGFSSASAAALSLRKRYHMSAK